MIMSQAAMASSSCRIKLLIGSTGDVANVSCLKDRQGSPVQGYQLKAQEERRISGILLKSMRDNRRRCGRKFVVSANYEDSGGNDAGDGSGGAVKVSSKPKAKRSRGFGDRVAEGPAQKSKDGISAANAPSIDASDSRGSRESAGNREPGIRRRPAPEQPLLVAEPTEEEKQIDNGAVILLGILFALIFAEGTFLAVSGFLPESLDNLAVEVVYPYFSPTVGLFLLVAASYGLYKYLGGPNKN